MIKMVKNTFSLIFSHPVVVIQLCFECLYPEVMFVHVCPFSFKIVRKLVSMVTK